MSISLLARLRDLRVGHRTHLTDPSSLGLLERWYALQPIPRILAVVLELPEPVSEALLRECLEALRLRHHRALGATLLRSGEEVRWAWRPEAALPLLMGTERLEAVHSLAEARLAAPFAGSGLLWDVATTSDRRGLVFRFHHVLTDGHGALLVVRELAARIRGESSAFPPPDGWPPLDERLDLRPGVNLLAQKAWTKLLRRPSEPYFHGVDAATQAAPRRTELRRATLPAELVRGLVSRAREVGATVHSALSAAALAAIGQGEGGWPYRARLLTAVSLRNQAVPTPTGLGVFVSGLESDFTLEPEQSFWAWATAYRRELMRRVSQAPQQVGLLNLASSIAEAARAAEQAHPGGRSATLEISNLGRVAGLGAGLRFWLCQGNHYHGPRYNLGAVTDEATGSLELCLASASPLVSPQQAEGFLERLKAILRRAASESRLTLGAG